MSRLQELLQQTPATTLLIIAICLSLHLWQFATGKPTLSAVTLCPRLVLFQGDAYRLITSALYHSSGFMHIGLNLMSTAAIGRSLEQRFGSLTFGITILWSMLLTPAIYIITAVLAWLMLDNERLMRQHSVGFSGVLFHLLVLECNMLATTNSTRSVFGLNVNTKLYPVVLLFALQVFMPGISFTGHLSGILVGYLQYFRLLDCLFPQPAYLRELESESILSRFVKYLPGYVRTPDVSFQSSREMEPSLAAALGAGWRAVCRSLHHALEAVCVILFGRGAEANANIRLPSSSWPFRRSSDQHQSIIDDDWSGLPEFREPQRQDV